ncbi:uncharacterized protein PHACADRAFT_260656 [Phanerochaete carnosa HHB-10118-sp]|uniref:Uncharacterized protein n=1 Tax=Phanerochaete carnosa (strain HHB-10118-sp) TaxID=650164 RepID=K5UR59_PHACS|nr:uncharacterized protein PHACADRAFT_260656 [Phanerochaete carnosa HHB-10118-sp]EKM52331.1 hypothetical protein PHACADRAFT_260656 [Phanerochaete carnosa HHB-10118-sp]
MGDAPQYARPVRIMPTIANISFLDAAASPAPTLPPLGLSSMAAIWSSAILYGMNCLIFGGALHVLFRRKERNWYLIGWSCLLWLVSTSDEIVAFTQLYRSLSNPALVGNPVAWDEYWLLADSLDSAHLILYTTVVFLQDLLLIWRLYVVWGHNWRVVLIPLVVECAHVSCAYVTGGIIQKAGGGAATSVQRWGLAGWSLDIFMNTTVTLAIAGKLWWAGRKSRSAAGRFTYRATVYTILESGGMFAGATLISFCLDVTGQVGGAGGAIYCLSQVASITPLVIIARVGLGLIHGRNTATYTASAPSQPMAFGSNPMQVHVGRLTQSDDTEQHSMTRLDNKSMKSLDHTLQAAPGPIDD